jgi:hypothetical protein
MPQGQAVPLPVVHGVKDVRGVPGYHPADCRIHSATRDRRSVEKEALIRASDADWTIVQAPKLTNGPATNTYRSGPAITSAAGFPTISRADVAGFMVAQVTDHASSARSCASFPDGLPLPCAPRVRSDRCSFPTPPSLSR